MIFTDKDLIFKPNCPLASMHIGIISVQRGRVINQVHLYAMK